jgi:phosphate uptake regulator
MRDLRRINDHIIEIADSIMETIGEKESPVIEEAPAAT